MNQLFFSQNILCRFRTYVMIPLLLGTLSLHTSCTADKSREKPHHDKRLVILGIDGMDPKLAREYMKQGLLPNLATLIENGGSFLDLQTSNPPQSPVAWSHFITGQTSKGHGIYDFVHRDPDTLAPYLSTSKAKPIENTITFGNWQIPLSAPEIELLREGKAFWEYLEEKEIPTTIFKVPANFPPDESWESETLSGMGTPDIMGTYGTFQVLTNDPALVEKKVSGGVVHQLDFQNSQIASTSLHGPPNPFSVRPEELLSPVDVIADKKNKVALIRFGTEEHLLQTGEWSVWIPLVFNPDSLVNSANGMVRIYLHSVQPYVTIYVSPVNIDPSEPLMPLSSPRSYVEEIAKDVGRFYTQGMPEDTKALSANILSDDEFLAQASLIFEERKRLLDRELSRFNGGVLFFYFSSLDQVNHVFFRTLAKDAPPEVAKYKDVIPNLYQEIDTVIGDVLKRVGKDTTVLIMSDHGFSHYRYKVQLNTWLLEQGYLALKEGKPGKGPMGHIDWEKTQAYALGLNQLFINEKGREPFGTVPPGEKEVLVDRIVRALEGWRNPETGERVVSKATRVTESNYPERAPDLLVGYARGYRSSDESATGIITKDILSKNEDKWSGDHCMDPAQVPGVLFSNRPLPAEIKKASLLDLAPTILGYFQITPPDTMEGKDLFSSQETKESP